MKTLMITLVAFCGVALWSCKPEALKDFETPSAAFKLSDVSGTWKMSNITQTDEDAVTKGFPYKTADVTDGVNGTQVKFTLNMNGSNPGTFTIDHGTAVKLFKSTAGNWSVDDVSKPSKVWFINGTDTVRFTIQNYNNFVNRKMVLKRARTFNGKAVSTYTYSFDKQ